MMLALITLAGAMVGTSVALIVRGAPTAEIGQRAFDAGIVVFELSPHTGSLEERFLQWTGTPDQPSVGGTEEGSGP